MGPSDRSAVPPFLVMEVMDAAAERERAGHHVIHLEVGQPSASAPQRALEAASTALTERRLGYGAPMGLSALRDRISQYYADRHGIAIPSDRIAITTGASSGFSLALLASFDPGQRIGLTRPGYAAYRNVMEALGMEHVPIPVGPHNRYVPTPDDLAAAAPLDGLVTCSPSNPTGTTLTSDEQAQLVAGAGDAMILADEIYHGIEHTEPAPTMLEATDDCIVLQSFSKYYCMTGWRVGWVVVPDRLVDPISRLASNFFICPPVLAQHAALAAFDATDELDGHVDMYRRSRDIVLAGLEAAGLPVAPADGGFYAWVDITSTGRTSHQLSQEWLETLNVAVTPGNDFDLVDGDNFIRIAYSESTEDITEAMRRISAWKY